MPPIVAAAAITAIAGAGTTIAASKIQSNAQKRASDVSSRANAAALAAEERDSIAERDYRKQQDDRDQANWDADQLFREREYNEGQANKRQQEGLFYADNARRNVALRRLSEIAGLEYSPLPTQPSEGAMPAPAPATPIYGQPVTPDRRRTLAEIGGTPDPNAPIQSRIRPTRTLRSIGSPRYGLPGRM